MRNFSINKRKYDYSRMIKMSVQSLKKINDEFTNADIDLIIHKKCSYGAFLWQKELVSEMKIYITYLGFIDALIVKTQNDMDWDKKFDNEDTYKEEEEKYNYYLDQRKKLLEIINSKTRLGNDLSFDIVKKVLDHMPASDSFSILYKDMEKNKYQLNLQLEFINAYNTGFMQRGYINYDDATKEFETSNEKIQTHRNNNKRKIAQFKSKYQMQ